VLHLDVVVEQRVVLGHLLDLSVAYPVDPAVAHVGAVDPVLDGEDGHDGGAHPPGLRVPLRLLEDPQVGELHRGDQPVLLVALGLVHLVRPGPLRIVGGPFVEFPDGVDGQLRGDLARRMAPHPVGHQVKPGLAQDAEVIFVQGAFATNVGLACNFDSEGRHGSSS
jgi:hypothetical protein